MNTLITIKVVQDKEKTVKINEAIENAYGEFDRIVKKFTRFNEDSELSNLNRQQGTLVKVSEEFFELIEFMFELATKTDGVFDPTVIDFLEAYGYDKNYDFSKLDDQTKLSNHIKKIARERKSFRDIEINKKDRSIKLGENQRIDLGGVGKGYAIDCAYNHLKKITDNFIIDAGGDIRASGKNEKGEIWEVGLKYLDKEGTQKILGGVKIDNESLACSGSWARKVKNFHHLIDPKTGEPTTKDYNTVFVTAPTAIESDSWATALFIGGKELMKKLPKSYKVLFV